MGLPIAKLTIRYDGDTRGLSEKRLSLAEFSPALAELLKAYRRTASNLLASAGDGSSSSTGRLHKQAELLDLEIESIAGNSAMPSFVATQMASATQACLIPDIALKSLDRLLQDIEEESKGSPQSHVARAYLRSLPSGIKNQLYVLKYGDVEMRRVAFGAPVIAEIPHELPRLLRGTGQVVGVGFAPGHPYVEIMSKERPKETLCYCGEQLVELALGMRGKEVEFLAIGSEKFRLLWMRDASDPFQPPSPTERLARIKKDWSRTLAALAQ